MFKKIKETIKDTYDDVKDFFNDDAPENRTVGEALSDSFFVGSGKEFWLFAAVIGGYCLITKQRAQLIFTKK